MKSILRFLCVVVMLQVSTPFMHGMNHEDDEYDDETVQMVDDAQDNVDDASQASWWQKIKQSSKKIGAVLGGALLFSMVGFGVYKIGRSGCDTIAFKNASFPSPVSQCPELLWDRTSSLCQGEDDTQVPFKVAIALCQIEALKYEQLGYDKYMCVPMCRGNMFINSVPAGWSKSKDFAELNCSLDFPYMDSMFEFDLCDPTDESRVERFFRNRGIEFCKVDLAEGIGFAYPLPRFTASSPVDYEKYDDDISSNPDYIKARECKKYVTKAQQVGNCEGPIIKSSSQNKKKKVSPKRKRRPS